MFADEELVMELLVNAGQARSDAMEAIRCAGQKDWQGATQLMASSESACLQAHKIQTALISQDEGCGKIKVFNSDSCTGSFDECNIMPGFSQGNYFIKKRTPCLIFSSSAIAGGNYYTLKDKS